MADMVVVGSSNTDMVIRTGRFPAPGETVFGNRFFMARGGKGANQAVAAARLGAKVTFVAKVGDDVFGREAVSGLRAEGIDTDFISVDPDSASGIAMVLVDEKGENCITVASGANGALCPADVDQAVTQIQTAKVLLMQLETPVPTVEYAAAVGRRAGMTVILNPAPAQKLPDSLLAAVDIITPNETEAEILSGVRITDPGGAEQAARILRAKGVGTVIITLGSRGAYIQSGTVSKTVPAEKVTPVDTTAAGDTFNGALAVGLVNGLSVEASVEFAGRAAAISVTRVGAQESAPYLHEVSGSRKQDTASGCELRER